MSANTSHCSVFTTNVYLIFIKFDYDQTVMEKASAFANMIKFYFYFLLDQNCCIHLLHRHLHLKKKLKKNATKSDSKYVIDNMANGAEIAACKQRMIDAY